MLISLVIPVFNEELTVKFFIDHVYSLFKNKKEYTIEYIFVNDGSTDSTLEKLLECKKIYTNIIIIDLSRNFGKEAALTAGLVVSKGKAVIPIDVDLQDPPELIFEMLEKWKNGFEVVLAKRINRNTDSFLKRTSAKIFYGLFNLLSEVKIPINVGDYRLMDRKVINSIIEIKETKRFMKGIFAWVGYKTTYVEFVRQKRVAGKSKFNGWILWNLALEGITSFSTKPLRVWTYFGSIVALTSFLYGMYIIIKIMIHGIEVPGYASMIVAIVFLGGIQLIGIGIIGEYLGRTYIETKNRPIYIIKEIHTGNN